MGEGTKLHGSDATWNVINNGAEHANDINDATLRRHLPLPGAAGGLARSDGTDWQRVDALSLADLASYARGSLIRGGATDWEALAVGTAKAVLTNNGTDVAWSAGYLDIASGKTLDVDNSLTLAGTDGKALTLTGSLTVGADASITGGGTLALGGYTLTVPGTGTAALRSDKLSVFAATTSAELAGVISDETGSGALMFGTSPTVTTSLYVQSSTNTDITIEGGTNLRAAVILKNDAQQWQVRCRGDDVFAIVDITGGDLSPFFIEPATPSYTLYLDSAGKVGIGTTSPGEALQVVGRIEEDGTFAEIYVTGASTAQTIATGATYTQSTAFTTNGQSANCTADAANDKITVTKAGRYLAMGKVSFTSDVSSGGTVYAAVFAGGVIQSNTIVQHLMSPTTICLTPGGIVDITVANTDVDLRFRHTEGTDKGFTVYEGSLAVVYVGET